MARRTSTQFAEGHHLPRKRDEVVGIGSLKTRQMEVLRLRCTHDMTNAEVAKTLNIATSTVKNTMTRIYRKLDRVSIAGACYDLCHDEYKPPDGMRAESV
jgi:DNA-binding CsgD family transcriptional regulator